MKYLRRALTAAAQWKRRQRKKLKAWWSQHRARLSEEIGYSETFAAVLPALADLITGSYRYRYAIRELVRAYIALQRIFSPAVVEPDRAVAT